MKRITQTSQIKNDNKRTGLARALSKLGYCSRSHAITLIREGKVQLNGSNSRNPEAPVRLGIDRIEVTGHRIGAAEKIYLMMNKPRGIVTTTSDEKGRDTIYSLLPEEMEWIAPVGRLDKASEGLLLMTNDSEWAARITNPATHLDKRYHVQIRAQVSSDILRKLSCGMRIDTGEMLRVKAARVLRTGEKNNWVEIVLDEGKNRQIRRIFEGLGIEVLRLIRIAIGSLQLGELPKGGHRPLRRKEKILMDRALTVPKS